MHCNLSSPLGHSSTLSQALLDKVHLSALYKKAVINQTQTLLWTFVVFQDSKSLFIRKNNAG